MKRKNIIIYIIIAILIIIISMLFFVLAFKKENNKIIPEKHIDNFEENIDKTEDELVRLPENKFDLEYRVPSTNIVFKYPSNGFYGLGAEFSNRFSMQNEMQVAFSYLSPIDKKRISEYIDFYIGHKTDKGNVIGEYNLENAIKAIKKIYGPIGIDDGEYKTFNGNRFYIYKSNDQNNMQVWIGFFLHRTGIFQVTINYLKPKTTIYGEEGNTAESRAAYINNDKLFLEILANISFE